MTPPPLISGSDISVYRGGKAVLDRVSITLSQGEFVTIVGPNGAGKSMLIKCLLGIIKPDQGRFERSAQLRIGYVPQRINIDPSLPIDVHGFLHLNTRARHRARPLRLEGVQSAIRDTGVEPLLDQPLSGLSGGELQRVLLARALIGAPNLLVLDEPTQNLDVSGETAFYQLIQHLYQSRELAVLMVSHDLHWVMASTERVICLYHHICCAGQPEAVAKDPQFVSLFGQDLLGMVAPYHHHHDHTHSPLPGPDTCDHDHHDH